MTHFTAKVTCPETGETREQYVRGRDQAHAISKFLRRKWFRDWVETGVSLQVSFFEREKPKLRVRF